MPGTYHGVTRATELRVQLLGPSGWSEFPLPVVTKPSGEFQAYVELGPGEHRLRLVDPATGVLSADVTVLVS